MNAAMKCVTAQQTQYFGVFRVECPPVLSSSCGGLDRSRTWGDWASRARVPYIFGDFDNGAGCQEFSMTIDLNGMDWSSFSEWARLAMRRGSPAPEGPAPIITHHDPPIVRTLGIDEE
jgi:hypothetical protein